MTRFEIKMRPAQRRDLDALAEELDLTASDLARVGIAWIIKNRDVLLGGPDMAAHKVRKPAVPSTRAG